MVTELRYAQTHVSGSFTNPNNALGNTPTTWAGTVNANSSPSSIYQVAAPSAPLTATQTVRVIFRKGTNSGNPSGSIALVDASGGVIVQGSSTTITSTTGQTLSLTFDASQVSDINDIRIQVSVTGIGGNPNTRNSAQISHIELEAQLQELAPEPLAPTLVSPANNSLDEPGLNFSWIFNAADTGDTQEAFAFRATTDADGTRWWNGATWQTTEVFITSLVSELTLPQGVWD